MRVVRAGLQTFVLNSLDSEYRVHTENTASLLEMQCTEELRTMEVRLLQFNRIPGKEVGGLKLVTTLIEVGTNGLAIQ